MTEYKIYEWYALARFGRDDGFIYVGEEDDYGEPFEFDTLEEAQEYKDSMIEPDGVVILRETRQVVC